MRILFLAPQPFHEVRGTPLAVAALARTLGELGHEVDLLTFPQGDPWSAPGVRHLRSARLVSGRVRPGFSAAKALQDIPFALRALSLARSGRYDVVHAVEESALLVAPFVPRGVRFVVDMDSDLREQLSQSRSFAARVLAPFAASLHTRALCRADLAIVINDRLAESAKKERSTLPVFRLEDPPLVSAPSEADVAAARLLRDELRLGDAPVILYTGNFEPYQGVDLLAAAAALVPEAAFVFVGGAADDIAAVEGRMDADTRARCRFVGMKPPDDLPRWLALAALLASPRTLGGNTPFKIYTYLAAERPILATRLDTHTQVLSDETAFLVEPTPRALADGIRAALADVGGRGERAARGAALLAREFSPARYREKVAASYAALARPA